MLSVSRAETFARRLSGAITQLHRHLTRLVDLEYINVHRGKHGRRYVYELLYGGEGHEGQPFLMGLIDPAQLKTPCTTPSLAG